MYVKDFGATGDGSTDDTAAFQSALYASLGKILFVDAGSYILTSTVTIPSGAKIVGETWSQLVASGSYFSDARYVTYRRLFTYWETQLLCIYLLIHR